ncbi:MAG: N-acetyl-gamma-glutamyl-phosphate reductase [Thermoflavifilum sp.]|nr:N-acetyl-gamma-glutamyl-phosphate reductase [Thermoflavifilum sp.]
MNERIKIGIVGGAGYTGGELMRILMYHPRVEIAFVHSRSHAGDPVYAVHRDLIGDTELRFTDQLNPDTDVWFLCMGHGESRRFLEEHVVPDYIRIIDLSQDFRLQSTAEFAGRRFVYGLPEWQREQIQQAHDIANPGCFATAIQLGLLPLAKAGLLNEVHSTAITGSTGAGQKLQPSTHFSWRAHNINAYKTLSHQHLHEIRQTLTALQPHYDAPLHFIPWRGDFTRGIFVSSQLYCPLSQDEVFELYEQYYATHPFTHVSREMVDLKQVINTNKVLIYPEKIGDQLVVHSVEDNLVKGASGQAVQNLNLMMGWEETLGLKLKASVF